MNISIIGAGNVAKHLSAALIRAGHTIQQVFSRSMKNAEALAVKTSSNPIDKIEQLTAGSDLYIIAVSDNAIPGIARQLNLKEKIVVHTSGSTDMDVLKSTTTNYGVFYPLQTFSEGRQADFSKIPVCIEASNEYTGKILQKLASDLSGAIFYINSEKRKALHTSAVFACNFVNHLYASAEKICDQFNLPFDLLKPLIRETSEKVMQGSPSESQTGPANRNDTDILKLHAELLSFSPELQEIYKMLSNSIMNMDTKKGN